MGQKQEDKILEVYYEYPDRKFTLRELSKITKIPRATVHNYLNLLKKNGLIENNNAANKSNLFKTKKINYYLEQIANSGLIEELVQKLSPSCIILFGSIRKGDSNKESDIDIFIETIIKKELKLERYERILKHKIQLFTQDDINKLPDTLFNNVINGIKIHGAFKVR